MVFDLKSTQKPQNPWILPKSMVFVVFQGKIDVTPLVPLSGLKTNQQCGSFKLKNCKIHGFQLKTTVFMKTMDFGKNHGFLAENCSFYKNHRFWKKSAVFGQKIHQNRSFYFIIMRFRPLIK